jgi:hypothetical protein
MGKCPYWKSCDGYRDNSVTCTQAGGIYHSDGHESSCVRDARLREADASEFTQKHETSELEGKLDDLD